MDVVAAWFGFVGAGALVAGPMYQGVVELSEVKVERPAIKAQADSVAPPERVSAWWWLLPPVAYVLTARKERDWRQRVMAAMPSGERTRFVTYSNKATGWFVVGAGAACIGIKEAIDLAEALEWPHWAVLPLVVGAAALATAFSVRRMHLTQRALQVVE